MVTDFHSHIMPNCDHGSSSVTEAVAQLKLMSKFGIERAVATPHFYPDRMTVDNFLIRRNESAAELSSAASKEQSPRPKIILGAEVLVSPGIDKMNGLERLKIEGTNTLLLEMPLVREWEESLYETVYNISLLGIDIVLAHVDRYKSSNVMRLAAEANAVFQLNSAVISKSGGKALIDSYVKNEKLYAIGSDLHRLDKKALRNFKLLKKYFNKINFDVFSKTDEILVGAKHFVN